MTQQILSFLTPNEFQLLLTFKARLEAEEKKEWTSDDFRHYGLDKDFKRPDKQVGAIVHKWQMLGFSVKTGKSLCSKRESNHGRRVWVWKWK